MIEDFLYSLCKTEDFNVFQKNQKKKVTEVSFTSFFLTQAKITFKYKFWWLLRSLLENQLEF